MSSSDALDDRVHTNRARAESFGSLAADYDRTRPSYPLALIDDLVQSAPRAVLDVGCGTGKASVLLMARRVSVLGIEIDERMADVARGHGVPVEVAAFESWDDRGRTFDLITCAQAWHWIDPVVGGARAASLLRPDGRLVLFWNFAQFDEATQAAMDATYAAAAPQLARESVLRGRGPATVPGHVADLRAAGLSVEYRSYPWDLDYSADEWLAMIATHSDHNALPASQREALFAAVRSAVEGLGGIVRARYVTHTLSCRHGS